MKEVLKISIKNMVVVSDKAKKFWNRNASTYGNLPHLLA